MEHKDGGPAFPARVSVNRNTNELQPYQFGNDDFCATGMSLRDAFAIAALQSGEACNWRDNEYTPTNGLSVIENSAICAYQFADAMLKARTRASGRRCEHCDGTGDVHSLDGEWRGSCDCNNQRGAA